MNTPNPPLTAEGLPVIHVSPQRPEDIPGWHRLSRGVIAANWLIAAIGVLGVPVALMAPMNLGMSYGSGNGFKDDIWGLIGWQLTALGTVGFPFICAACIGMSLALGRHGKSWLAIAVALMPLLFCLMLSVLVLTEVLFEGSKP